MSDRPGRIAAVPQALEQTAIPHGVHALPEGVVAVGHQLTVLGEPFEGGQLPLRGFVVVDVVGDAGFEDEESRVDPSLPDLPTVLTGELGLLDEAHDSILFELDLAEAGRWMDDRHRGERPVRPGGLVSAFLPVWMRSTVQDSDNGAVVLTAFTSPLCMSTLRFESL